jgi:hypothetical protein
MKHQATCFRRYYTTNLDSYTSLLAMLTSIQVPYRAYEAPESFATVNEASNLVGALTRQGWKSLFVCTSVCPAFLPVPQAWDARVCARNLPEGGDWVSLGQNQVEAGTEDKAALDTILSFMRAHPRTVVMQEMINGHYLAGLPLPPERPDVLVIGHSGHWVYGLIDPEGRQVFLDALDGVVLGRQADLPAQRAFERFTAQIDSVARLPQCQ